MRKKHDAKSARKAKVKAKRQKAIQRSDIEKVTGKLPFPAGAKIGMSRAMRASVLHSRDEGK
tara:strand:+ start:1133 stop:1318 length:186 start_codon:yes stop_codon:yes gene_type:complete